MMRTFLAVVLLVTCVSIAVADAQAPGVVYVPHGAHVIAIPLAGAMAGAPAAPPVPPPVAAMPGPAEGGLVRIDGLPPGATLAVDGYTLGGGETRGGWIALPPGPHFLDVALPGGGAIRLTVVTPVESSGYQVVPQR